MGILPNFDDFPDMESDRPVPGGNPEDVDATLAEPMNKGGDMATMEGQQADHVPHDRDFTPAPVKPQDQPVQQPAQDKRSPSFERRISRLTRRAKEADEQVDLLKQQNELLRQRLELQEARSQSGSVGAPAAVSGGADLGGAFDGDGGRQGDDARVAAAVQKALQPIVSRFEEIDQRQKQQDELDRLENSHKQSYTEAAEEFPELRDQNSELFRVVTRLYAEDENLRSAPDAPYRAALMARGILADEARAGLSADPKKQSATITNPPANVPSRGERRSRQDILRSLQNRCSADDWYRARQELSALDDETEAGQV